MSVDADEQSILVVVRQAFTGELRREYMPWLLRSHQVCIAAAIMLTHPAYYFEQPEKYYIGRGGIMKWGYGDALFGLLVDGIIPKNHPYWVDRRMLFAASQRLKLHKSVGRPYGAPSVMLTPFKALVDLVGELGATAAATLFHQQAISQELLRVQLAYNTYVDGTADDVADLLSQGYSKEALVKIVAKLQYKLSEL